MKRLGLCLLGVCLPQAAWAAQSAPQATTIGVSIGWWIATIAPIAALIFAFEVLMLDLTAWSIVPLLIASVTAATVSYFFLGEQVVFSFTISEPMALNNLPFYILLGIFTGLVSLYFTRMNFWTEKTLGRIKNTFIRLLIGGLLLCTLIFMMPHLFGEGYSTLRTLLTGQSSELFNGTLFEGIIHNNQSFIVIFFLMLVVFKVIAMALTTGSGGVGGIFAPALFVGGMSGISLAKALNLFTPAGVSENNFALVGMAGVMSGVMHAPLTAIFLIAEITGGYELLFPLMLAATISYGTTRYFVKNSVYTVQLAKRGELMTHHKDRNILLMMKVTDLIETNFSTVRADETLRDLIKVITRSSRNIFPVVDEQHNLKGIVKLDDIRHIMFNQEMYDTTKISDLMINPEWTVENTDQMEEVARVFTESQRFNIPVLQKGKYLGFVSRAKVFSSYREMLKHFSDD